MSARPAGRHAPDRSASVGGGRGGAAAGRHPRPWGLLAAMGTALACAGALAGPADAQVVVMEPVSEYYRWTYRADFDAAYQTNTAIDGGGAFDALRFRGAISSGGPISRPVRLYLDVAYAHTAYDFGSPLTTGCVNAAACFRGSPWSDVHTVDVAPGASLVLNDAVHVQVLVPIRWQAESGGDRTGVTAGAIGMVRFRIAERFVTGLGVGVQSELEEDARVFPVIALDWRISDRVQLATSGGPYQGGIVELMFGPPGGVQAKLSSGWVRQRFRLTNALPNPDGVGQYSSVPVMAGFRLRLGQRGYLDLEGGVAVAGRLRIENAWGFGLRAEDFDTAGLVRGAFRLEF